MIPRLSEKEHLQAVEMLRPAVLHKLIPQCLCYPVEHRKRPAPFEDPLRWLIVCRLPLVAVFPDRNSDDWGMAERKDRIGVPEQYHLDLAAAWIIALYNDWGKPAKAAEWRELSGR